MKPESGMIEAFTIRLAGTADTTEITNEFESCYWVM
jgi:hypothetical protein